MKDQRYYSGEEIHIGDRVTYGGCPSTVVFVIDRDEFPQSEGAESREWWRSEYHTGFMVHQDAGADILLDEADEDLLFICRAEAFPPQ